MKYTKEELNEWRDSKFLSRKTQYCQDVSPYQPYVDIQGNPNQNPMKLLYGY